MISKERLESIEHVCIGPTCAKSIKVRELNIGRDNVCGSDLGDWIVVDAYPPGDMGLHLACSVECLLAWNRSTSEVG